jgi:two-component system, NtrC family, response regulator AtoC
MEHLGQAKHEYPDTVMVSPSMQALTEMINQAAATDATVLVWGESGVGKELVARMVHDRSVRSDGPFVKVNCAALPLELLESELFGYERGAFTGAHRQKPGKYELAHGGTICLDEMGEMPLPLQAKLLHVLQDGRFSRLGGGLDIRADARVVAMTNKDLAKLVERGQFREDLYYRLNVVKLYVPPLRERRQAIPILVDYFLSKYSEQYQREFTPLSDETTRRFMEHSWPGNIRELENLVKRIVVLRSEQAVLEELSNYRAPFVDGHSRPAPLNGGSRVSANGHQDLEIEELGLKEIGRRAAREAERQALATVLERVHWRRREAAVRLKISYTALLYKMKEHGLGR